jgi:hypothetical protein
MSTYNRRNVKWWNSLSYHAAALAIDIDPANNPMIQSKWPKIKTNIPEWLVKIFNNNGFIWWWNRWKTDREKWSSFTSDAMHFEFKDIDYLASVVDNKEESKLAA